MPDPTAGPRALVAALAYLALTLAAVSLIPFQPAVRLSLALAALAALLVALAATRLRPAPLGRIGLVPIEYPEDVRDLYVEVSLQPACVDGQGPWLGRVLVPVPGGTRECARAWGADRDQAEAAAAAARERLWALRPSTMGAPGPTRTTTEEDR